MNKPRSTTFLIILFILQLTVPVALCIFACINGLMFEAKATEYKLRVNRVMFDEYDGEGDLLIEIKDISSYDGQSGEFLVFVTDENGYYVSQWTDKKPENNAYLSSKNRYPVLFADTKSDKLDYQGYSSLYDSSIEADYIERGIVTGDPTQAYAIVMVYKDRIEVKELVIDNMTLDVYIDKILSEEINIDRYSWDMYYDYEIDTALDGEYSDIEPEDMSEIAAEILS